VVVLEKEKFPRFHVGESLLPYSLPILEKLGVLEKVRAAGFQEKYGAYFWNDQTGHDTIRPVVFRDAADDRHPMAFQVKRAEFDELLLRHSASCGAEVREEVRVDDVPSRRAAPWAFAQRFRTAGRRNSAPTSSWTPPDRAPSSRESSAIALSTRS
jgi:2-polyprenyl-6-methoxyphenol hydroxylase-like FAD-dependent oxidoreductase